MCRARSFACLCAFFHLFSVAIAAPPVNDSFTNPQVLTGGSGMVLGSTEGSTLEDGEIALDATAGGSVWFRWSAPTNGTFYFRMSCSGVCRSAPPIYTGTTISDLVPEALPDGALLANTGVVYRIPVVELEQWGPFAFTLTWSTANPANDYFGSARSITTPFATAASGSVTGSNVGATWEYREPQWNTGQRSVWHLWRAPFSGVATFDTVGSALDTLLAVYTQRPKDVYATDTITNLTLSGFSDDIDSQTNSQSRVSFNADAGHKYWIVVDGANSAEGNFTLNWNLVHDGRYPDLIVAPIFPRLTFSNFASNDCVIGHRCATPGLRRLLAFGTQTINIGNADLFPGGIDGLEFEYHPCHGHSHLLGFADYRLVTNGGGTVVIGQKTSFCLQDSGRYDTNASEFSRYFCLSFLNTGQGIQAGWSDYYWDGLPCQWLDITGVPPGLYTLEVEVDPSNQFPELNDSNNTARALITLPPEPYTHLNDNFETAMPVTNYQRGNSDFVPVAGATRQPGEPALGDGHTVWFRWTSPSNGLATFDTVPRPDYPTFDTVLGLFTGDRVDDLTLVAMNDDIAADNRHSRVRFQAQAGIVYHIAIDGAAGETGSCALNWYFGRAVLDDFNDPEPPNFPSNTLNDLWSNVNATKQPGEPNHAGNPGGHSVWRSFTANISRQLNVTTASSDFDTVLAVYTGDDLGHLTLIASNDDAGTNRWSALSFMATAGVTYHIAIDGKDGDSGRILFGLGYQHIDPSFEQVRLTNGAVELVLVADDDKPFTIEASLDLTNWFPISNGRAVLGVLRVVDTTTTNAHQRFYRAKALRDD
jgi:hypothetical protein